MKTRQIKFKNYWKGSKTMAKQFVRSPGGPGGGTIRGGPKPTNRAGKGIGKGQGGRGGAGGGGAGN
jgi:hypothetical protein